jgi:iron uptake system EfeUOB component EfeO/EfeM
MWVSTWEVKIIIKNIQLKHGLKFKLCQLWSTYQTYNPYHKFNKLYKKQIKKIKNSIKKIYNLKRI